MSLAVRLTHLRQKKGESLQQTGDAVGVSKAHIWEIERGKADNPSMNLVKKLAEHFCVTVSYLAGEDINADDADQKLAVMFRKASVLDGDDLEHIDALMDSLIKKRQQK